MGKDGLKILMDTYWDSKGWKSGEMSNSDFILAKEAGYMFDNYLFKYEKNQIILE